MDIWNVRMILTGLNVAQRWKWKELNKEESDEDMVVWCQRGYEKIWSVLGGCTVLEKMNKKNYWGIWLTRVHLEDGH